MGALPLQTVRKWSACGMCKTVRWLVVFITITADGEEATAEYCEDCGSKVLAAIETVGDRISAMRN